jgi:hypothetical protein
VEDDVARRRQKDEEPPPAEPRGMDVNAVVSYNLRTIRVRQGWTQEQVARRLAALTGHELPQASISAMERGYEGGRRRRFDAHEIYLLSWVFGVPIIYFFIPPPATNATSGSSTAPSSPSTTSTSRCSAATISSKTSTTASPTSGCATRKKPRNFSR